MRRLLQILWFGLRGVAALCVWFWFLRDFGWQYKLIFSSWMIYAAWLVRNYSLRAKAAPAKVDISKLSPLGYEDYCALLLRDAGWRAHTTPLQDQGADVIAVLRGTKAVIQCKMYTRPVGNRAVQEIIAGRLYYGAHIAVVVSPAVYTCSAVDLASRAQVILLHHDQLPMLERIANIR